MHTAKLHLDGNRINEETVSRALDNQYIISCEHDLLCTDESKCGCYNDIKLYVSKTLLTILGSSDMSIGAFPAVASWKFSELCSLCSPESRNVKSGWSSPCFTIYGNLVANAPPVRAISFMLDAILTGAPNLISFYKRTPQPIFLNEACYTSGSHRKYEYIRPGLLTISLNTDAKNKRISAFLEGLAGEREDLLKDLVAYQLRLEYTGLRCRTHINPVALCKESMWSLRGTAECRSLILKSITDQIKRLLGRLTFFETSEDTALTFKRALCMKCRAAAYPDKPQPAECHGWLVHHSHSLPSLVRFLLEYTLTNESISGMRVASMRELEKTITWWLPCLRSKSTGTQSKFERFTNKVDQIGTVGQMIIGSQPVKRCKSAVMLYGKTCRKIPSCSIQ